MSGSSDEIVLSQGSEVLVDAFPTSFGYYVVLSTALLALDEKGETLDRREWPREIVNAEYADDVLVVIDRGRFTSLDAEREELASGDLLESCDHSLLVSKRRFVCASAGSSVFHTYSAEEGEILVSSKSVGYGAVPARHIPGTDDFVSVDSPEFVLHSMTETGEVVVVGQSNSDVRASSLFAFDGSSEHIVTRAGLLLKIHPEECGAEGTSAGARKCFVQDGILGTLGGEQVFRGLDSDSEGTLYALIDVEPDSSTTVGCTSCLVERIDVEARSVVSQRSHAAIATYSELVVVRHAPNADALLVGHVTDGRRRFSQDPYPGHRLVLLGY